MVFFTFPVIMVDWTVSLGIPPGSQSDNGDWNVFIILVASLSMGLFNLAFGDSWARGAVVL